MHWLTCVSIVRIGLVRIFEWSRILGAIFRTYHRLTPSALEWVSCFLMIWMAHFQRLSNIPRQSICQNALSGSCPSQFACAIRTQKYSSLQLCKSGAARAYHALKSLVRVVRLHKSFKPNFGLHVRGGCQKEFWRLRSSSLFSPIGTWHPPQCARFSLQS